MGIIIADESILNKQSTRTELELNYTDLRLDYSKNYRLDCSTDFTLD